jgi:serine/threonine-protein kinase
VLRLGRSIRPLGGGLFTGGGLSRRLVPGRSPFRGPFRGRRRMQLALVSMSLLVTAGVGWAASRDTPEVVQAQAAGAGPAAGVVTGTAPCAVRYQLRHDSGSHYVAVLTVVTTDEVGQSTWRVQFSYPGTQRLTGAPRAVTQKGRKVVAKGNGTLRKFLLRGAYRDYNPLPLTFSLDGRRCRAEVLATIAQAEALSEATPGGGKRNRPARPQKRADRADPPAPQPATPSLPPLPHKGPGLSLALR